MIAALKGKVIQKSLDSIVVDVGGVGYRVFLPLSTYSKLPKDSDTISLFVHTLVREDAITLYGFMTEKEREIFLDLIGVSGIGAKIALNVLSRSSPIEIRDNILSGDVDRLKSFPGIGKKTAERLVLELKEKLEKRVRRKEELGIEEGGREGGVWLSDVVDALVNLGYTRPMAEKAALEARVENKDDIGEILKSALKLLSRI